MKENETVYECAQLKIVSEQMNACIVEAKNLEASTGTMEEDTAYESDGPSPADTLGTHLLQCYTELFVTVEGMKKKCSGSSKDPKSKS